MPRVMRTPQARRDLKEILAFLNQHSPAAAQRLADAVNTCCRHLEHSPEMGRVRDELLPGIRSLVADQQYLIFYRIRDGVVRIVPLFPGAQHRPFNGFG